MGRTFLLILYSSDLLSCVSEGFFLELMRQIIFLPPNGLRYLRWGGDGEAVQPEK